MKKHGENIYTIPDFLTASQCDEFIVKSDNLGYEEATVETDKGAIIVEQVRNNKRVLYKDEQLAMQLWKKINEFIPKQIGNSYAIGLNELLRFYKYGVGHRFKKHIDQSFIRSENEASFYTLMIYLNDSYKGGETKFRNVAIQGEKGMALIFLHSLEHEGCEVRDGIKYVLRTDIMYRLAE